MVGAVSTAIHVLIASCCLRYVNDSMLISNIAGFLTAYLFSYFVQSKLVFQQSISAERAVKYFAVQFCTLLLAIFVSQRIFFNDRYLQTVIVAFILVFISFGIHRFWTFNKKESVS